MLIDSEETYKILCEEYPLLQKGYLRKVIDKVPSAEVRTQMSSADLISRQDALDEIKARFEDAREWYRTAKDEDIKVRAEATIMSFTECSLMLKNLPSAEPKLIRCKDCKHRPIRIESPKLSGFNIVFPDWECPYQCEDGWYNRIPDDDFFCANGEKEGEEE